MRLRLLPTAADTIMNNPLIHFHDRGDNPALIVSPHRQVAFEWPVDSPAECTLETLPEMLCAGIANFAPLNAVHNLTDIANVRRDYREVARQSFLD